MHKGIERRERMETRLIIRLSGSARDVFARLALMARLAGGKLTLGHIAELSQGKVMR